jgi:holliday junction DNA helicase RuvB
LLKQQGDLATILTHMKHSDILFVDEIHRLNEVVMTVFYAAITEYALDLVIGRGTAMKNVRFNPPRFSIVAATTEVQQIQRELLSEFRVQFRLDA